MFIRRAGSRSTGRGGERVRQYSEARAKKEPGIAERFAARFEDELRNRNSPHAPSTASRPSIGRSAPTPLPEASRRRSSDRQSTANRPNVVPYAEDPPGNPLTDNELQNTPLDLGEPAVLTGDRQQAGTVAAPGSRGTRLAPLVRLCYRPRALAMTRR